MISIRCNFNTIGTIYVVILDLVPSNPISDMAAGKVVPVLIFAIFIAVAIVHVGSKKPESVAAFDRDEEDDLEVATA